MLVLRRVQRLQPHLILTRKNRRKKTTKTIPRPTPSRSAHGSEEAMELYQKKSQLGGRLLGQIALLDGPQAGLPPLARQLPAQERQAVLLEPFRPRRRLRVVLVLRGGLSGRLLLRRLLGGSCLRLLALLGRRQLAPEAPHRSGPRRRQRAARLLGRHLAPRGRQQDVHPAGAEHVVGRQRRDLGPAALLLLLMMMALPPGQRLEHARVDDEVARVVHHELRHGHRLAERPHAAVRHHQLPAAAARRRGTRDQVAHFTLSPRPSGSRPIAPRRQHSRAERSHTGRGCEWRSGWLRGGRVGRRRVWVWLLKRLAGAKNSWRFPFLLVAYSHSTLLRVKQ
uniref:Uncharacterized protein n=1 Tax=Zea mays TaxID=4577 RepID=A0A804LJ02_MAIZE